MSRPLGQTRLNSIVAALVVLGTLLGVTATTAQAEVPPSVLRTQPTDQYPTGYGAFQYDSKEDGGPARPGFVAFYSDDDRAGIRTQITNVIGIDNPEGQVKDIQVQAPAGALAAIANADLCSPEQYRADNCPQTSLVADTTARATAQLAPLTPFVGPIDTNGSVYSLRPPEGSRTTARLGIILRPAVGDKVMQFLDVRVRDEGDYGLEFNLKALSNSVTIEGDEGADPHQLAALHLPRPRGDRQVLLREPDELRSDAGKRQRELLRQPRQHLERRHHVPGPRLQERPVRPEDQLLDR